jgi:alpha-D-ribose 1-methylphosphonate 5-triphosphate synthase subunit PhnH
VSTPAGGRPPAYPPTGEGQALHDAFRATLLALARPGEPRTLPGATDEVEAARLVLDAVWEPDSPPVIVAGDPDPGELLTVPIGTEQEPELGATVVVIAQAGGPKTPVRLSGPGVDGESDAVLPVSAGVLAERARACARWPRGIDLVLIGPGAVVRGLPRSTAVRVIG